MVTGHPFGVSSVPMEPPKRVGQSHNAIDPGLYALRFHSVKIALAVA